MTTNTLIEMEARLHRLERHNRVLILLFLGLIGIGSIAATHRPADSITASEIRTAHLTILDNHGKVLTETVGVDGEIHIKRYAPQERSY
jgi:hypothetical protein